MKFDEFKIKNLGVDGIIWENWNVIIRKFNILESFGIYFLNN